MSTAPSNPSSHSPSRRGTSNRFADLKAALQPESSDQDNQAEIGQQVEEQQNGSDVSGVDHDAQVQAFIDSDHSEIATGSSSDISLKRNSESSDDGMADGAPERPSGAMAAPNASDTSTSSPAPLVDFAPPVPERRSVGRPAGKKSSRDYCQVGAYIPLDLYDDLKEELVLSNRGRRRSGEPPVEISGVVEKLLRNWIEQQRGERSINR